MADIQSHDPLGTSAGQPGGTPGPGQPGGKKPMPGIEGPVLADRAGDSLRTVADRATETWDDVSRRGADSYRQGSRAVSNADNATIVGLFIAGAIGFGLGWLVFGQPSVSGDFVARRMSDSSDNTA